MKRISLACSLALLFITALFFSNRCEAKKAILLEDGKIYRIDLDGGEKEIIETHVSDHVYGSVIINGKMVIPPKLYKYYIIDLYKKDKYKEVLCLDGENGAVYRWNGVKLQDYCKWTSKGWSWRDKKVKAFFKKAKKDPIMGYIPITYGDGTISARCSIQALGAAGEVRNNFYFRIKYKVKRGKITFVKQREYKNSIEYYWQRRYRGLGSGKPWIAYRYPKLVNNTKVFSIQPGEKYHTVSVRFGNTYTYIKVQNKRKKTGWLIFKTNSLGILDYAPL